MLRASDHFLIRIYYLGSEERDQASIFSLVWLDAYPSESTLGCNIEQIQDELRSNFDRNLKIFEDDFECEYYIRNQPLFTKILFLVDEVSAQIMVERASYISQIVCTFVYRKQDSSNGPRKEQNCPRMVL
jgi:hypothetical protein